MTNKELLARFEVEHMDASSISPHRRREQLKVLDRFASHLNGRLLVESTPADVLSFLGSQMKSRNLAPNTGRKFHGMIRAFNTWAYSVGLIDPVQMAVLKAVPNPRGSSGQCIPKPYKPSEIREFYEVMGKRYPYLPQNGENSFLLRRYYRGDSPFHRRIWRHARRLQFEAQVSLALEEGLRMSEILNLTIPRMHYDNEGVVVLTAKSKPGQRREREVPFTAHSRACVEDWLDFRETLGLPHSRPWLRLIGVGGNALDALGESQMEKALNVFGDGWNWHRFRHTFATERLRAGLPLEQLRIMLGHGNLEQTLAYAEIVNQDVQKNAEATEQGFAESLGLVA